MTDAEELVQALESLVDKYTLSWTLDALSTICGDKAEHLESQWQDERAARAWRKMGRKLGPVVEAAEREGL